MSIIVVVGNKSIITCHDTSALGPLIYIDFHKINRPCLCAVTSTFSGNLLVTAQETKISSCSTQVVVNGSRIFGCPLSRGTSATFTLLKYHSISVQVEFTTPSSSGHFYQCLGFQQKGKIYFFKIILKILNKGLFLAYMLWNCFYTHCLYYVTK